MERTLRYRRWLEVRFYHWCYELYSIRHNLLDVVLAVEAVAQITDEVNISGVKNLAGNILSDPYLHSTDDELIILAHEEGGISIIDIAKHFGKQRTGIYKKYKAALNKDLKLYPRLDENYDTLIEQFFEKLELFKSIGF